MNTRHHFMALAACLAMAGAASAQTVTLPGALDQWDCLGQCGSLGADGHVSLSPLGNAQYAYVTTADSGALGASPLALDANSRGAGTEQNGSRFTSGAFTAGVGDVLDMRFNYVSTDGKGFDDYAWARIVNASNGDAVAWIFTARSSNSSTGKIVPGDVVRREEFDPDLTIVGYDDFDFHTQDGSDPIQWSPLGGSNQTCWRENAAGCGYTGWLHSRYSFAQGGSFRVEVGVVNWGDYAYDSGLAFDFSGLQAGFSAPVPEPSAAAMLVLGLATLGLGVLKRRRAPG
jgi:hypothetical protein